MSQTIDKADKSAQHQPFIIAVIPAYNESKNIAAVIKETSKYVNTVIVIDDGSLDRTKEAAASTNAVVIRNKLNMGKGFALKRGIIECLKYNPDIVVTIDADGQHDPSEIPKLLNAITTEDADVVIGSRYERESVTDAPSYRKVGLYVLNNFSRILVKTSIKDTQSGYRAYTKEVLSTILKYDSVGYGVDVEQLASLESSGFHIIEVPITVRYHGLGNTYRKRPFHEGINILSTIFRIAVERKPLLFFGFTGLIFLLISVIPLAQILIIFNETRFFSLSLALISFGLAFIGSMLILISFVFFALKRIRQREEVIATTLLDFLNKMKR